MAEQRIGDNGSERPAVEIELLSNGIGVRIVRGTCVIQTAEGPIPVQPGGYLVQSADQLLADAQTPGELFAKAEHHGDGQ